MKLSKRERRSGWIKEASCALSLEARYTSAILERPTNIILRLLSLAAPLLASEANASSEDRRHTPTSQ